MAINPGRATDLCTSRSVPAFWCRWAETHGAAGQLQRQPLRATTGQGLHQIHHPRGISVDRGIITHITAPFAQVYDPM